MVRFLASIFLRPWRVIPWHAGHPQSRVCMSCSLNVPSRNIILSSLANLAYEAESKRSHPMRVARARIIGWPAPKRCTGRDGFRPFLDAITTSTSSA